MPIIIEDDGLAHRLHAVQFGSVIIGVPRRIEIVIRPRQTRVQRTTRLRLFGVDRPIVVRVCPLKDVAAAAKHPKAIHQRIFPACQIGIESREDFLVDSDAGRRSLRPSLSRPRAAARSGTLGLARSQGRVVHEEDTTYEYQD